MEFLGAEECRRRKEALNCPLCRTVWQAKRPSSPLKMNRRYKLDKYNFLFILQRNYFKLFFVIVQEKVSHQSKVILKMKLCFYSKFKMNMFINITFLKVTIVHIVLPLDFSY